MLSDRPYHSKKRLDHEQVLTVATYCQSFGVNEAARRLEMSPKTVSSIRRGANYKKLNSVFEDVNKIRPARLVPRITGLKAAHYRNIKKNRHGKFHFRFKLFKVTYNGPPRITPLEAYQDFLVIHKEWFGVLPPEERINNSSLALTLGSQQ